MGDVVLVLAWLVLAHVAADFLLQTGTIARRKSDGGASALGGLLAHGLIVAACLVPVGLAYGGPGWIFVGLGGVSHVAIDRIKVVLTRRAAAAAVRAAVGAGEGAEQPGHLGQAWTPWPAGLFLADQAAHLAVSGLGWAVLLATTPLEPGWTATVDRALGGWDRSGVHAVVGVAVVLAVLTIVNLRAASLFVGILVRPVEAGEAGAYRWGSRATPLPGGGTAIAASDAVTSGGTAPARRWSIRLGPLTGQVIAEEARSAPASTGSLGSGGAVTIEPRSPRPTGASARVGSTIGILERVLIVVFVLAGVEAAIGFVVAAKTLARFKLLDDRDFAEYYLLGTLASVSVAIISALIGRAALVALLA